MRKPKLQLKVFLLIGLFWMSCLLLHAQNPLVKQWDKRFGGTGYDFHYCFKQTSDGGFILGGYSYSGINGDKTQANWDSLMNTSDYWIVKIDSMGNKEWDKVFGGNDDDILFDIQQTTDGGYILGGASTSGISGNKTQTTWGQGDYWVVKIDSLGNKQWDKDFGGTLDDYLISFDQTNDGGYILGGFSFSGISGDKTEANWDTINPITVDYWLVKIDSIGNKQWDKTLGGSDADEFSYVEQTFDGGFILGGLSLSNTSGDKTQDVWGGINADYWIVKTDSIGNKEWDKDFGGIEGDFFNSMQQTKDGGYILKGISLSDISGDKTVPLKGGPDYWIIKTDSIGNMQWDKDFGGTYGENDFGNISQTIDGGYLMNGISYSNISGDKTENNLGSGQSWIVKTDSFGIKLWDKTLHTNAIFSDQRSFAIQSKDGCYVMTNWTRADSGGDKTSPSWGGADYWIIKFCDTTQIMVAPTANLLSTDTTFCEKHCIDFYDLSTNNPTSWQWFFPGSDSSTSSLQNPTNICYNNYGSFDVTLIACNAAGCDTLYLPGFINEYQTLTPVITQSNDTLFSSPGVAYQWWSVDSGIITGATNNYFVPTQGGSYYVIVTDSNGCNGVSNTIIITAINSPLERGWGCVITPNPNQGTFTITLSTSVHKDFSIRIINAMGQTVLIKQEAIVNGQSSMVNLPNAVPGLYAVEVINDGKVYRQKFVVATLPK